MPVEHHIDQLWLKLPAKKLLRCTIWNHWDHLTPQRRARKTQDSSPNGFYLLK